MPYAETYIQIKNKGETYSGIIEMRIDDTNYDDYIDYIIYTIHELKANTKSQIEGFRFVTKQLKEEKSFTGWIYYGHKIPQSHLNAHLENPRFEESFKYHVEQLKEQEKLDNPDKDIQMVGICRLDTGNYTPLLEEDQIYNDFIKNYRLRKDLIFTPFNTSKVK